MSTFALIFVAFERIHNYIKYVDIASNPNHCRADSKRVARKGAKGPGSPPLKRKPARLYETP
jgi:hypothetical protein